MSEEQITLETSDAISTAEAYTIAEKEGYPFSRTTISRALKKWHTQTRNGEVPSVLCRKVIDEKGKYLQIHRDQFTAWVINQVATKSEDQPRPTDDHGSTQVEQPEVLPNLEQPPLDDDEDELYSPEQVKEHVATGMSVGALMERHAEKVRDLTLKIDTGSAHQEELKRDKDKLQSSNENLNQLNGALRLQIKQLGGTPINSLDDPISTEIDDNTQPDQRTKPKSSLFGSLFS